MQERDEAIEARVKQLLKDGIPSKITSEHLDFETLIEPMLRYVYAQGWAHAEIDFAEDYFRLEDRLHDPGPEWDYLKKLAKKRVPEDGFLETKQQVLIERAQEIVELMRTEHGDMMGALRSLPSVKGGLLGRAEALHEKSKEDVARLEKALAERTKAKKKVKGTAKRR